MNARGMSSVEAMRLRALRKLEILDTAPERAFDRLVSMAACMLDAPMAILSFIDKDRQWLKAARGFEQIELPRALSFCTHAIDEAGVCEVLDAAGDARFSANPFVVGPPRLRYYAGARLRTSEGYPLGMLAVLDDRVRAPLSEDHRAFLESLAAIAMDEVELRSARRSLSQKIRALEEAADESARRERELIAARELADRALQAEGRFLAHMSHELRTPLTGVLGMNALLLDSELSPDQRNMAEAMQESGRALLALIGDILDASKLHHGRLEITTKQFSVPDLVERSLTLVEAAAAGRRVSVQVDYEPGVPAQAVGDPLRLQQILLNLLDNSVKFGLTSAVRVSYSPTSDDIGTLRFEVRDSGPGLDANEQRFIFDRFRQSKAGAQEGQTGTGLGLFIARELAELMGGRIGVESASGAGAMFWFEAPVVEASSAPQLQTDMLKGLSIVIVGADRHLDSIEASLCAAGARVRRIGEGGAVNDKALAEAFEHRPSLLLIVGGASASVLAHPGMKAQLASIPSALVGNSGMRPQQLLAQCNLFLGRVRRAPWRSDFAQAVAELLAQSQERTKPSDIAGAGVRVLLAEDDSVSARVASSLLTAAGGDVTHVPDGQEAVERAAGERFDLIVLDIRMPRLDGLAVGAHIRRTPGPNQSVPMYAVTAEATAEARAQALDCGFTDFITKPYRPEALRALVKQAPPGAAAAPPRCETLNDALLDESHVQLLEEVMSKQELRALLDLWTGEVRGQLDTIEATLHAPDALAAGVHKLKGTASSFGAVRLAAIAGELKTNPTPAKIANLRAALASTVDDLRKRVAGSG